MLWLQVSQEQRQKLRRTEVLVVTAQCRIVAATIGAHVILAIAKSAKRDRRTQNVLKKLLELRAGLRLDAPFAVDAKARVAPASKPFDLRLADRISLAQELKRLFAKELLKGRVVASRRRQERTRTDLSFERTATGNVREATPYEIHGAVECASVTSFRVWKAWLQTPLVASVSLPWGEACQRQIS